MKTFKFTVVYLKLTVLPVLATVVFFSCQPNEPALSSDKSIIEFSFLTTDNPGLSSDVHATITDEDIHCTFPAGTTITTLKPTIIHDGNSISPSSGVATNFTNEVNYTVTAKDQSTKPYKVSVTVTPPVLSSKKMISSFSFLKADNPTLTDNVQGTINGKNILCTVPSGISLTALKPTIVHTGISINPPTTTANNFTTPATYTVTAEDATTENYTITVSVADAGPSVYVVGGQRFFGTNQVRVWKNGVGTSLTNGTYNAAGSSIFVKNNSLYVSGYQSIGRNYATYWQIENGVELPTPGLNETINDAYANSIYVSDNNDVYVAGHENQGAGIGVFAKVWKNGTATTLTNKSSAANSVFVSGNDVYVAGMEETTAGYVAKVWKNGIGTALSPEDGKAHGKSVFVSDGIVYVAGHAWNGSAWVITVWKNGTPQTINNAETAEASSLFVSNGDVYLVGTEVRNGIYNAKIWKNGIGTFLSEATSQALSVYIYGDDVYVAGWANDNVGAQAAMVWKNGVGTPLATDAFAYGVMVK